MLRFVLPVLLGGCAAFPRIDFNDPPGGATVHIEPASPYTDDPLVGAIDVDAADPDGDVVSYTWSWYHDGVLVLEDQLVLDASYTVRGTTWEVVAVADDGEWAGSEARAEVVILNSIPEVTSVEIEPANPGSGDDLRIVALGHDDDDTDAVAWHVEWHRNGIEQPDYADLTTLPAAATDVMDTWSAVVTPWDGTDEGTGLSAEVSIGNTVPELDTVTVGPDDPNVLDTLTASVGDLVDPDDQVHTVAFTWYVNDEEVFSEENTTWASTLEEPVAKGDSVQVLAVPYDGVAYGTPVWSNIVVIENSLPVVDWVSISPTTATEATELVCSHGATSDADGDPVSTTTSWYVDGSVISSTADTLDGASFSKGNDIYCVVEPNDGESDGESVASSTVTVENTLPTISSVSLSPTTPTKASSITAAVSGVYDADGDSISYLYAWKVNGSSAGSGTSTLGPSSFERWDTVQLTVTPSDGSLGTAVTSDVVEVGNSPPSLSSASISPSSPSTAETLVVTPSGFSDADGDPESYRVQWYRNDVALEGETGQWLDPSLTTRGDRFYCAVTPTDPYDDGSVRTSGTVTIVNSTPVAAATAISGLSAEECDEVLLDASASTDRDEEGLSYTWSVASKPSASLLGTEDFSDASTADPSIVVDAAGTFKFNVTVSDGSATDAESVSVVVSELADNTAPVANAGAGGSDSGYGACSSSGSTWTCAPCSGTTFTVDASSSYDADGHPLHYTWSTTSTYAAISSTTAESTTVKMERMPATHGVTTTYTATLTLRVVDCAGDASEDYVELTYDCYGT